MRVGKLALNVIVKDELDLVKGIVAKYGKYFDEICLAVDERVEEFRKELPDCNIFEYKWINDFSHKRNFLAEKTECEYYLRIDTDDDIINPELIPVVFENMKKGNFDVAYFPYIYSRDTDGNCNAEHWRETIIKKRPDMFWKKEIHENIFIEDQNNFKGIRDKRVQILHNLSEEHAQKSTQRNLKYLLDEYARDKERTDPRTVGYLGRVFMGLGEYKKAIPFFELLIKNSGWDDDKYFAWVQMADCWHNLGRIDMAIASCNEALTINTQFPDAYLKMGTLYLDKQDFTKALDWIMPGLVRPKPDTMFVIDPSVYGYRARTYAAIAYLGKGDVVNAWKYFQEAKALAPSSDFIKGNEKSFEEAYTSKEYLDRLAWIVHYTKARDEVKLKYLVKSIPSNMLKDERVHALKTMYEDPVKWSDKSVVIYCGYCWEEWCAPSVLKGIGGSEEAVIYLSKELAKLGHEVTVYCACGDMAGEYEGVTYKPFYEINPRDEFNVLIAWRGNIFNGSDIKARKKYIWMHDVPFADQFKTLEFDKVIVLSDYHKSLLNVPEDKIFVSANGINLPDFEPQGIERNPKRIIYTSSYDRGLQHLLMMWEDVIKEVPDAELHIFYGWKVWEAMEKQGARDPKIRQALISLMQQPNIFEHGRIGHKKLVKEFMKSGIYAYPSHFSEISCISAMKAQACGCVALTTDFAALDETNKFGIKIKGQAGTEAVNEEFKNTLIDLLKNPEKQEQYRNADKSVFGWDKVALQWKEALL